MQRMTGTVISCLVLESWLFSGKDCTNTHRIYERIVQTRRAYW